MPYSNEHACRLFDPKQFKQCRRTERISDGKVYGVVTCELKQSPGRWREQAYRYDRQIWSETTAKAHCEKHQGKFEPAREPITRQDLPSGKFVPRRSIKAGSGILTKERMTNEDQQKIFRVGERR